MVYADTIVVILYWNSQSIFPSTYSIIPICPSRSKLTPLDILKFLVDKLRTRDNKVIFIQVDEDGALARNF